MLTKRFTLLINSEEKLDLEKLAEYHHRSQGDVVRVLIRTAIQQINQGIDSKNLMAGIEGQDSEKIRVKEVRIRLHNPYPHPAIQPIVFEPILSNRIRTIQANRIRTNSEQQGECLMKITEMFPSRYLKADDLPNTVILTIKNIAWEPCTTRTAQRSKNPSCISTSIRRISTEQGPMPKRLAIC